MTFEELYKQRKEKYGKFSDKALRIHRTISWGKAAEKAKGIDEQFIFYWIALNAAYTDAAATLDSERTKRRTFFEKISDADTDNQIKRALIDNQNYLRVFVENKFLYDEYWRAQKGEADEEEFEKQKNKVMQKIYFGLLTKIDEVEILDYLFTLMAVLRNQIFHGLATYQSQANREQLKAGVGICKTLIPIMAEIVLNHEDIDWGEVSYPYIQRP